jgi:hypothetical protein
MQVDVINITCHSGTIKRSQQFELERLEKCTLQMTITSIIIKIFTSFKNENDQWISGYKMSAIDVQTFVCYRPSHTVGKTPFRLTSNSKVQMVKKKKNIEYLLVIKSWRNGKS